MHTRMHTHMRKHMHTCTMHMHRGVMLCGDLNTNPYGTPGKQRAVCVPAVLSHPLALRSAYPLPAGGEGAEAAVEAGRGVKPEEVEPEGLRSCWTSWKRRGETEIKARSCTCTCTHAHIFGCIFHMLTYHLSAFPVLHRLHLPRRRLAHRAGARTARSVGPRASSPAWFEIPFRPHQPPRRAGAHRLRA